MASIDKIYGNKTEWEELFYWLARNRPQYCKHLYPPFWMDNMKNPPAPSDHGPISNFPFHADKWLYKNCPFKWVKERIREQYNGSPLRRR